MFLEIHPLQFTNKTINFEKEPKKKIEWNLWNEAMTPL